MSSFRRRIMFAVSAMANLFTGWFRSEGWFGSNGW